MFLKDVDFQEVLMYLACCFGCQLHVVLVVFKDVRH
jgi:hypothetical protein